MGVLEAFLGAAVGGFGALLLVVAALAWRGTGDRKMGVLAGAFAAQMFGGLAFLVGGFAGGPAAEIAPVAFAAATLASLILLYAALFARRG